MQQYSDLLTQRLEQRQAMRSTQSMPLGRGAAGRRRQASNSEDEDSDADGEAEVAPQRRLPAAKKAAKKQRPTAEQQVSGRSRRPCAQGLSLSDVLRKRAYMDNLAVNETIELAVLLITLCSSLIRRSCQGWRSWRLIRNC